MTLKTRANIATVVEDFPAVEFYCVEGAPVGPYVIRQSLIDRSNEHLLVFHDSDDISCFDRIARQAAEIRKEKWRWWARTNCAWMSLPGPSRFTGFLSMPLPPWPFPDRRNENDRANEPLLHPTLTMVRSGFVQAGGFSTNRKIANDTQFMLRAYFSLRMRNVDSFLYIRRRHSAALTVAKETALGTPLRHFLGTTWGADFEAVKSGKARLEETSLWPRLNPLPPPPHPHLAVRRGRLEAAGVMRARLVRADALNSRLETREAPRVPYPVSRLKSSQVGAFPLGQACFGDSFQHHVFNAVLAAESPLLGLVAILIDHIKVRLHKGDFRFSVQPAVPGGNQGLVHVPNRMHHVKAFVLGQQGVAFTLQQRDVRVMPHDYVQIAQRGSFFEKSDVPGVEPVVAAGYDHTFPRRLEGRRRERRHGKSR